MDSLLEKIVLEHPGQLQKDETLYLELKLRLKQLKTAVGDVPINARNEHALSLMYEDLTHMETEVDSLRKQQREDPYELI